MPGLKSEHIRANNGFQVHHDITLSTYINNWIKSGRVTFPKWQREDCWGKTDYRTTLIESILQNHDLPKLFLSKRDGLETYYLLDGGHRTRAIHKYIDNEYAIEIDGLMVYYDKITSGSERNNRVMNAYEKDIFDKYKLTITIYSNLSEKEARSIFNKLQNAKPMSMADIVNSHESSLIDYLRSLSNFTINGQHLSVYFDNYKKVLVQSGNSHMLYQLASWWTVCFPPLASSRVSSALAHALKGEKKETSTCYTYVTKYVDDIDAEQKKSFESRLTYLIPLLFELKDGKKSIGIAEATSILHASIYVKNFSMDKFVELIDDLYQYSQLVKASKKAADSQNYALQEEKDDEALELNNKYSKRLSEWKKIKSNLNESSMKIRYDMIVKYCVNQVTNPSQSTFDEDAESLSVITS